MNVRNLLWDIARSDHKRALPILSFPAAQKLGVTVSQLVQDAELQARAMALVSRETDTIAAISLMDLSVEAQAFGAKTVFHDNEVPAIVGQLISDEDEANDLAIPDLSAGRASLFVDAVRLAKERIADKPLIAGMIGPFSLAGRLMDVTEIMYACFDEPETVEIVLEKATAYLIAYGSALKKAGADGLMMAEPLAGILSPDMNDEFSIPYVRRIIDALQDDNFAVIYHNCGGSVPAMLPSIYGLGAAAYHFGNAVNLRSILENTPENVLVMGNIDPAGVFAGGTPEAMTAAVQELKAQCGSYANFLPSSGCDIPAHASWDNIRAFFDAL